MARMLSPNFWYDEFVVSDAAVRLGIDNTPDAEVLRNLKHLAAMLELVRTALGNVPMRINSGYRCDALNAAIKGAKNSQHKTGLAVDFTAQAFGTVLQTAKAVAACGIAYDQVIYEYGTWVHLGVSAPGAIPKGELLSIGNARIYHPGLKNVD